jgi:hypothetical protein
VSIHEVSAIFFRLVNFAALLVLGGYIFYKYMLNGIKQKIAQQHALRENKIRQKELAHEENEKIKQSILLQAQVGQALLEKVAQWSAHVEQERRTDKQNREEQRVAQEKRHELRREQLELNALKKIVMPDAIKQARQELVTQFADKNNGEQFMNSLIAAMDKSIS